MTRKQDALEAYRLWKEISSEEDALRQALLRGEKVYDDPTRLHRQAEVALEEAQRLASEAGVTLGPHHV